MVVEFVTKHNVDVEAILKSLIPHIEVSAVTTTNDPFGGEDHKGSNLQKVSQEQITILEIVKNVKLALDDSANESYSFI